MTLPADQTITAPVLTGTGAVVSLHSVSKTYGAGAGAVLALDSLALDVGFGEFLCIVGASGCGKSTLLNLIAGLDRPTSGTVEVRGGKVRIGVEAPQDVRIHRAEIADRIRPVLTNAAQASSI